MCGKDWIILKVLAPRNSKQIISRHIWTLCQYWHDILASFFKRATIRISKTVKVRRSVELRQVAYFHVNQTLNWNRKNSEAFSKYIKKFGDFGFLALALLFSKIQDYVKVLFYFSNTVSFSAIIFLKWRFIQ